MPQTNIHQNFPVGPAAQTASHAKIDKLPYTSPQVMEREWEQVWTKTWLFAGLVSDLEEAGDYFIYELGRESIIVMRDEQDRLAAFYNVCQHRGNRLFTNESGAVAEIACPYHGWRYGLDGRLSEVPDRERFGQDLSQESRSLKPVLLETWAGLVWVNMDLQAAPLSSFLGLMMDNLTPYHFENMVLAQHQTVLLDANWKTAKDNFLEQYHVDFIHPQHAGFVDCCNSTNYLWPYGHSGTVVEGCVTNSRYPVPDDVPSHLVALLECLDLNPADFRGRVPQIREAVQVQKRKLGSELGFDYGELSDAQVSDVWQYDFFPNLFMTVQPEELWIYGPRPHPSDPNKCFFDKWTLQVPAELSCDAKRGLMLNPGITASHSDERPPHEVFTQDDVIAGKHSMTITIDQDIYYLRDMQAGLHSRGFDHACLNEDEARVQHFHDWWEAWMSSGDSLLN
jgi:phenylpropionate dioxygenase-like ring-hydroxylating dioxygenase large terminal subunit